MIIMRPEHTSPHKSFNNISVDETLVGSDPDTPKSPLMKPAQPRFQNSPSPPPEVSHQRPRFSDSGDEASNPGPGKNEAAPNEQTLLDQLDNGRQPEIYRVALSLPADDEDDTGRGSRRLTSGQQRHRGRDDRFTSGGSIQRLDPKGASAASRAQDDSNLQNLAAGALEAVQVGADPPHSQVDRTRDISASTKELSIDDDRTSPRYYRTPASTTYYGDDSSPKTSPHSLTLPSPSNGLPPIVSPASESNGQSLPSIRSTLGDMKLPLTDQDPPLRHTASLTYPQSPHTGSHQLPPIAGNHGTPPISPPESYPRSVSSPRSQPASSPYNTYTNMLPHRPSIDAKCGSDSDLSGTEKGLATSSSMSATTAERMSIDGITNQGIYVCTVSGCKAPPFQTQYLLNSHANVHSSARPHYCPVAGCSRSEGGKGFKRKNEMIRHGLVHDSPGYVCPFCPDRDHKYPRPDNLQRHVRVHHIDKNKDDPLLREVLAQRADGPNRGRRRRGGT